MWSGRSIGRSYPTAASPTLARVFAPRHLLAVLATAALAAPGSAFAQGAGDDQYQDPFASAPKTTKSPPAASNQRAQADQPSLSDAPPASSAPAQTQRSSAPASASAPAQAAPATGSQLPYTGAEIPAMALMGLGLLGVGVGLRLRTLDETLY